MTTRCSRSCTDAARIITSPAFNGDRIFGAILFEGTMDRDIEGQATADYLWNVKQVVPFVKVDQDSPPRRTAHAGNEAHAQVGRTA